MKPVRYLFTTTSDNIEPAYFRKDNYKSVRIFTFILILLLINHYAYNN